MSVQPYTSTSVTLLGALRSGGKLKASAFAAHVRLATGRTVSEQQVGYWINGDQHFPADLVPVLAGFVRGDGLADQVLNAYAEPVGFKAAPDVVAPAADPLESAGRIAELGTDLFRAKVRALRDGRVDASEREELRAMCRELLAEVEATDAGLKAHEGGRR